MSHRVISDSRVIPFTAEQIFSVLASPQGHVAMDGSGTVLGVAAGPQTLRLGDRFRMKMRLGAPYRISSVVKEFEQDRLIAWSHFGGHRWRYELEPVTDGTKVTESFDWSTSIAPRFIELVGYPERHRSNIAATLERLSSVVSTWVDQ